MDLLEIIKDFQLEYQKFINDFAVVDEEDPLSPEHIKELEQILNQWYQQLKHNFTVQSGLIQFYQQKNTETYEKYIKTIDSLSSLLTEKIKTISENHANSREKLKNKIESSKSNNLFTIEQLELDYDYFLTTSEQNKEILTVDFEEARKRFDYQKEEAKGSYLEVVKRKNEALDEIKNQLKQNYEIGIKATQQDHVELVEKIQLLIDEKTEELENITEALENEKNNMKEKYRQESANLNAAIKKYADEKNKTIDQARSQYNKSMNDAIIERENKKQVYQTKSQALLKEFVTKITEIDEQTAQIKKEFDLRINQIKRTYYSNLYEKTKIFHSQLESIYASTDKVQIDRYTNHLIQYKNKQYIQETNLERKSKELELLNLTQAHTITIQDNKNNKNFLEIDKNYAIKEITNQEQFDNKYYQEKDNFYESDFNYVVKSANYRFAQKANVLRCQSQIRTKLLERNYDGIEANYYKRIETIQNKINSYQLERKLANELVEIVLDFQEKEYQSNLHLEEVTNLIEIEKNKILNQFNLSQYEYNVKNIELERNYGFKKIDLENQKAEKFKKLKIELENDLLKKNNVSTSFSIKREELEEKFSKLKSRIKNNNALKSAKEKYLSNLKVNDIYYLNQIVTSYNHFFENFKRMIHQSIQIITQPSENMNLQYLNSFVHSFLEIFTRFFVSIFDCLYQTLIKTINDRLDYIHQFKYKSSLDTLKENYMEYQSKIKGSKNMILDEMDSANKTIENFKQKIYTLINDNEMLKQNNKYRKKRLDSINSASIRDNELKIKEYKEKIDDFNEMLKMHSDDLQEYNLKILQNSNRYHKELKKINRMQLKDSYINIEFKNTLSSYHKSILRKMEACKEKLLDEVKDEKHFNRKIYGIEKQFTSILTNSKNNLTMHLNHYVQLCTDETYERRRIIKKEFDHDIAQFNAQYAKSNNNFQKEYKLTIASYEKQIHDQNVLISNTIAFYDSLLLNLKNNFESDSNRNQMDFNQKTDQFLISYYALEDNNQNIISFHQKQTEERNLNFKNDKFESVNRNTKEKDEINKKLKNFIETKNEEIEHLPIAFKFNSKMLNNETRKRNSQIHMDLRQAKTNHNMEHHRIEKEINNLKNQLNQEKNLNELNQRQNIVKEKKDHHSSLKQSLRNITIKL